jgi:hypothetical protein
MSENLPELSQAGQRRKSTKFLLPHSHCWLWSSEDQSKKSEIQFLLLPTGAVLRALRRSGQDQGPDAVAQGMFSIHLLANDSFLLLHTYFVFEEVESFLTIFRRRIRF